jgi:excisionase family DNA binding protein
MERPEHWMAWDAERVTGEALREWARELRRGKPRWLTPGEVAERYGVTFEAVGQWVAKGWIPATRYGNWWVSEADLEGWVVPCERSKAGIPKASGRRVEGKAAIVPAEPRERKAAA